MTPADVTDLLGALPLDAPLDAGSYYGLLETRSADVVRVALARAHARHHSHVAGDLLRIGVEERDGELLTLYPSRVRHLAFPYDRYLDNTMLGGPSHRLVHPTWAHVQDTSYGYRFGGSSVERCGVCGQRGHHLLTLNPVPSDVGVSHLTQLEIVTCLSCLGWEQDSLFYQHDADGRAHDRNRLGAYRMPSSPSGRSTKCAWH